MYDSVDYSSCYSAHYSLPYSFTYLGPLLSHVFTWVCRYINHHVASLSPHLNLSVIWDLGEHFCLVSFSFFHNTNSVIWDLVLFIQVISLFFGKGLFVSVEACLRNTTAYRCMVMITGTYPIGCYCYNYHMHPGTYPIGYLLYYARSHHYCSWARLSNGPFCSTIYRGRTGRIFASLIHLLSPPVYTECIYYLNSPDYISLFKIYFY